MRTSILFTYSLLILQTWIIPCHCGNGDDEVTPQKSSAPSTSTSSSATTQTLEDPPDGDGSTPGSGGEEGAVGSAEAQMSGSCPVEYDIIYSKGAQTAVYTTDASVQTDVDGTGDSDSVEGESKAHEVAHIDTRSILRRTEETDASAPLPSPPCGEIINFAAPVSDLCKSFEYYYDDNHLVLMVPNDGVVVTRVDHFRSTIWTALQGEHLEYAKAYLSNRKVFLVLIAKKGPLGISGQWYTKSHGIWTECRTVGDTIRSIKTQARTTISEILIDLNNTEDIPECSVFEARILGLPARFYYPKPGYVATEVVHGYRTIWRSDGYELCISCDLYFKEGKHLFALLSIKDGRTVTYKYFENTPRKWKELKTEEFDQRRRELLVKDSEHSTEVTFKKPKGRKVTIVGILSGIFSIKKSKSRSSERSVAKTERSEDGRLNGRLEGAKGVSMDDHNDQDGAMSDQESERDVQKRGRMCGISNSGFDSGDEVLGQSLDISSPKPSICRSIDYNYDDNAVRLIVALPETRVIKLMDGQEVIWESQNRQVVNHAKLYLKNGKPNLIYAVMKMPYGISQKYYAKDGDHWRIFMGDYIAYIDGLKVYVDSVANFSIDLSSTHSTPYCTIFEVELLEVNTRFFYPKHGCDAKEVTDGASLIWEAADSGKCISCDLYTGNGKSPLLLLVSSHGHMHHSLHFEKVNGEWINIAEDDFRSKRNAMNVTYERMSEASVASS